ncbi:MAG: molybdopterin-dependent oxidoreductase [Dehalococcoidia bacterium]|nr:molybdopterin-dependent oxidoreductase [Dehalococcoidia bacterium]
MNKKTNRRATADEKLKNKAEEQTVIKGLCFIGSGNGGANAAEIDVKQGKIIRIRPLHYDKEYDRKEFNSWKMEARGKILEPSMKSLLPPFSIGYKNRVYSSNRVLYPLKRIDWDPNGERNPEARGKSGYVRISWDDALDIIISEIKRVKKQYGTEAILSQSDGHAETKKVHAAHGANRKLLKLLGGYTLSTRNPDSWEGWVWGAKHVWGMESLGQQLPVTNVMLDISRNTDTVLFWGCDPETTPWGFDGQMASRMCYWFSELGIESIYICPDLNYGAAVHADKWIPIRPNTDAALQLAIANVWLTEKTYDKDYVDTHVVGFDKFAGYVMGKEDGIVKAPEWAAKITGVPSWVIKALARHWAQRKVSIAHGNGGSGYIRGPYATENARLEVVLLGMQGLGKPGANQVKMNEWLLRNRPESNPMPRSSMIPSVNAAYHGYRPEDTPRQFVPRNLIQDAILNPPISWYGTTLSWDHVEQQFIKYTYPVQGAPEIHMIWQDTPSQITCWNDTNTYVRALRSQKIEFILSQHPWLENDVQFADIILPVSTKFEEEDIGLDILGGQFNLILHEPKCIEPVGESRSDYEIVCMLAERLGLLKEYSDGKSVEDWIKLGFETSGTQEHISFEKFKEKGYWVAPTDPNWESYPVGLIGFYEDPVKNPLSTPTGKLEFFSQRLAERFPGDEERPPVPHFIPYGESHQESLQHPRAGKYPLLIISNHPRWRVHAQHDDMKWLREIPTCKVRGPDGYFYEPLWMHPVDAAERNIRHSDVVKVFNERGAVLGGAYITERIMPGSVYMDHGARYDPIVTGELDRGGAINTISPDNLTSKNATGMVVSAFLVEVEKANLDELRAKYPEAFNRPYHELSGLSANRLVVRVGPK